MSTYRAPVQDMIFALKELAGLQQLAELPSCEEASEELVVAVLDEANKLASDVLGPLNIPGDQTGLKQESDDIITPEGFADAYRQFVEGGWGSLQFEEEFGGQNLPFTVAIAVQEMWHAANMSWGLCPLLTQGAIEAIAANGSEELKAKYLPNMVAANWTGTMNLTEPQAGSDMAILRSIAEPMGDHYRIKGQKMFITWGEHDMAENIIHLVLARLPDAPEGVKGISLFLVPKFLVNEDGSPGERNDCRVVSTEHKMGIHASPTCVMSFGEKEGAIGYLVGQENRGLACMFSMMNNARLTVGLQGVAISERAYQLARTYATERPQGIDPATGQLGAIIKHADVRRMLMTMRVLTEAGRALAYVACAAIDVRDRAASENDRAAGAARAALLTPIVKGWCTEIAQEVTSTGVQIHGGMGFVEETGAAQHMRDARILPIYEGTNGIQAMDFIGRKTLSDGGTQMEILITEIKKIITSAPAELKDCADQLDSAVSDLSSTLALILEQAPGKQSFAGSVAFHYLMQAGVVCGGWQMLKAAIAAHQYLTSGVGDAEFFTAKIQTARFFMSQILPRQLSSAAIIKAGATDTMAMDEAVLTS